MFSITNIFNIPTLYPIYFFKKWSASSGSAGGAKIKTPRPQYVLQDKKLSYKTNWLYGVFLFNQCRRGRGRAGVAYKALLLPCKRVKLTRMYSLHLCTHYAFVLITKV